MRWPIAKRRFSSRFEIVDLPEPDRPVNQTTHDFCPLSVRRVGEVARLMADAGIVVLVPVISPFRAGRDRARAIHGAAGVPFIEVFVDTPIELCERRDPKGLYAKARRGELTGFTGIDSPYEPPLHPDLVLTPGDGDPTAQAERILALL